MTTGSPTQVQLTANVTDLNYVVGQIIKFKVPAVFGMPQLDGVQAEVLSFNSTTNTYTVDLDSSSFTAFAWPASSAVPHDFPTTIVVGNDSSSVVNPLTNLSSINMELGAGIDGPAGSSGDVIYWRAGKSFSVMNS